MSRSGDLKRLKKEKEKEKQKLENRKKQTEDILRSVQNEFDGEINKLNCKMMEIAEQQDDGFISFAPVRRISVTIRTSEKEDSTYSDTNMRNVQNELSNEIRELNSKIRNLEQEISSLEGQIRSAEAQEEAERRQAEAERRRAAEEKSRTKARRTGST